MSKILDEYINNFKKIKTLEIKHPSFNISDIEYSTSEKISMIYKFAKQTESIEEICNKCRENGFFDAELYIEKLRKRGNAVSVNKGKVKLI
jgi:hypothetical protein